MSNHCQVPTPEKYVQEMLDAVGYKKNLYGKRVLENSCGEGNVLVELVKRYIEDAKLQNYTEKQIILGLQRDIVAYEIDEDCIQSSRKKLNSLASYYGLKNVQWTIHQKDFLKEFCGKFQYIVGNPPYITYHDLDESEREYLKIHFSTCEQGRFDYSYAFIEASLNVLAEDGRMAYLVPHSIIKNKFAGNLRRRLLPVLKEIYDYKGIKIFPEALTSPILILCDKKENQNIVYTTVFDGNTKIIEKKALGEKWIFNSIGSKKNKRFGDFFEIFNSVATLYNKAFILSEAQLEEEYYRIGDYRIEKELVHKAASKKSENQKKKNGKTTKIIFPYQIQDGKVTRYSEQEFKQRFPEAWNYLFLYSDALNGRKSDQNARWFEYGRSQAIVNVLGEKLLIPMVITKGLEVLKADFDAIPYAGYFIKEKGILHLADAKQILESEDFYRYVQECGTPTTPTSYRVSVNDIKEYRFE